MGATTSPPGRLGTVTDTSTGEPDAPAPPAQPAAPVAPTARQVWGRRLVIGLVLGVAFAIAAWGMRGTVSGEGPSTNRVVQVRSPGPDALVLRQTEVGADLREGFDGRLVINGIAVPEDQMEGVVDPTSTEASQDGKTPALRPNNRRHVFFAPGPGKVLEKLPQGKVTITVNYFRDGEPGVDRGSDTWTITAN